LDDSRKNQRFEFIASEKTAKKVPKELPNWKIRSESVEKHASKKWFGSNDKDEVKGNMAQTKRRQNKSIGRASAGCEEDLRNLIKKVEVAGESAIKLLV